MSFFGLLAGFGSGYVGLGGGVILNPIFIAFEVFPQVAFSTSMYLALYSSLANTILFYLAGFIFVNQSIVFGILSFVASVFGIYSIQKAV